MQTGTCKRGQAPSEGNIKISEIVMRNRSLTFAVVNGYRPQGCELFSSQRLELGGKPGAATNGSGKFVRVEERLFGAIYLVKL